MPPPVPASPPEEPRRIRLTRRQWIGMPLMALLPLLALLGLLDEHRAAAEAADAGLALTADFPARLRYGHESRLRLHVENRSARAIDTVTVTLDAPYARAFEFPEETPTPEGALILGASHLQPGERRALGAKIVARNPGVHAGTVRAQGGGAEAGLPVRTTILP